jgi:hypothetical protein
MSEEDRPGVGLTIATGAYRYPFHPAARLRCEAPPARRKDRRITLAQFQP